MSASEIILKSTDAGAVWSTSSCVAVSCLPDCDGEADIVVGPAEKVRQDGHLVFDSQLETPSGSIVVETVLKERMLQVSVPNVHTRVRIWTSGVRDTDRVIGVGRSRSGMAVDALSYCGPTNPRCGGLAGLIKFCPGAVSGPCNAGERRQEPREEIHAKANRHVIAGGGGAARRHFA